MSNTLKFKAWDKVFKRFIEPFEIGEKLCHFGDFSLPIKDNPRIIVVQYTGHNDIEAATQEVEK